MLVDLALQADCVWQLGHHQYLQLADKVPIVLRVAVDMDKGWTHEIRMFSILAFHKCQVLVDQWRNVETS